MSVEYYECGDSIDLGELRNPRAIEFARTVGAYEYSKLIRAVRKGPLEGIECDVYPEIPQHPVADIQRAERVCVLFPDDPNKRPQVLALRASFPSTLLHLNEAPPGHPRSLCLFAEDFRQVARFLTAPLLLRRVLTWLGRAAAGQSHLGDQPLEPFVLALTRVIYDPRDCDDDPLTRILVLRQITEGPPDVYRAELVPVTEQLQALPKGYVLISIRTEPWHARMIDETPVSLRDLVGLLEPIGTNLIPIIQGRISSIFRRFAKSDFMHAFFALLVRIPKAREPGGNAETLEDVMFFVKEPITSLGEKLGVLVKHEGRWVECLGSYTVGDLGTVKVGSVRPVRSLDRAGANQLAGIGNNTAVRITAVGAGAIGSQVLMNLARQGFGRWVIIDEDQLLPHNLSRHGLAHV